MPTPRTRQAALPARRGKGAGNGNRPTDDELLDGALSVFATTGYDGATMGDIASWADATKPTLYAHFGNKEALYRATIAREARNLEQHLFAAYDAHAGQPTPAQVRGGTLALFDYARAHPDGFRLLFGDQSAGPAAQTRSQLVDAIRDRVAQLIRDGSPLESALTTSADILAAVLVTGIIAAAEQASRTDPTDTRAAAELTASAFQAALAGLDPQWITRVDEPQPAD